MGRICEIRRLRRVLIGAPDARLTPFSGMVAVTELVGMNEHRFRIIGEVRPLHESGGAGGYRRFADLPATPAEVAPVESTPAEAPPAKRSRRKKTDVAE